MVHVPKTTTVYWIHGITWISETKLIQQSSYLPVAAL
jgi:hypothetical protein